jgi:hypothetical protein
MMFTHSLPEVVSCAQIGLEFITIMKTTKTAMARIDS